MQYILKSFQNLLNPVAIMQYILKSYQNLRNPVAIMQYILKSFQNLRIPVAIMQYMFKVHSWGDDPSLHGGHHFQVSIWRRFFHFPT